MISLIGTRKSTHRKAGYTFVEVLLAVVVFSTGMVGIFQTLIVSLDRMSFLTNRMYANLLLDNKISQMERSLKTFNSLPFELNPVEEVQVGSKVVAFQKTTNIQQLPDLNDIFDVTLTLNWQERGRGVSLSKSAYLANFETEP